MKEENKKTSNKGKNDVNKKNENKKETKQNENKKKPASQKPANKQQTSKKQLEKSIKPENKKQPQKVDKKSETERVTKKEKATKKVKNQEKEKKPNKFIEIIKKKWLINGTKTFILVAIIIALFIAINQIMKNLELSPLDFSQEKLYTLSEESKDKVKDVNKDVKIYFVGYEDSNSDLSLAKQFKNTNEKITAEAVNINDRPDLASKYGIESGTQGIIVEGASNSKVLTSSDLTTYDTTTYETISIAEEKLTSAILSVTSEKTPKVYFLNGYSSFSLSQNMNYLKVYLANEVTEVDTLDLISTGKVPDDCDTLVITTPNKDFDDIATNAITDYINSGRDILWFNAAVSTKQDLPNINKILALYGINPFEVGVIRETDSSKMASNQPDVIIPEVQSSKITKDLYNSTGVLMVNATKLNLVSDEVLEELNVTKTDLLKASSASYFRNDFSNQSQIPTTDEQTGEFVIGAEFDKTLKEKNEETGEVAKTSKMVIYGENYFISDYPISQSSSYGLIQYAYNKDLAINSISYLVDREEDITVRKSTGTVTYTATEEQNMIIQAVIFVVPILIIIVGIVVWQVRRRRK